MSMFSAGALRGRSPTLLQSGASAAICRICPAGTGTLQLHHPMRQVPTCPDDDLAELSAAGQIDHETCCHEIHSFPNTALDKASLGSTFKRVDVDDHLGVEVEDRWDTGVVLTHVAGSVCAQQPAQVLNSAESQLAAVTCTLQNSLNTVAMWNYIFSFSLPSKLAPQIGWIISPLKTCLPKQTVS